MKNSHYLSHRGFNFSVETCGQRYITFLNTAIQEGPCRARGGGGGGGKKKKEK